MRNLGKYCIIDPDSGKLRPNNEVIIGGTVITDGDSKGALRFIAEQASIITSFVRKAAYYPDIGHFLKCISSAFYELASNDSSLRSNTLL